MNTEAGLAAGLSFDDILDAVQDSRRGRWFLDEFQKRASREDSGKILAAISKIECHIESMGEASGAASELSSVRDAIAKTRREIALLTPETQGLSSEGKLFAHLAEMARKTLPAAGQAGASLPQGIYKALHLVSDLDAKLNGYSPSTAQPGKPADAYFAQDNQLFEAPSKTLLQAVTSPELPSTNGPTIITVAEKVEPVTLGAKLEIRCGTSTTGETAVAVSTPAPAEAAPVIEAEKTPVATSNPRIVIIRRKPEEMTEVPSHHPVAEVTAA